MTDLNIRSEQEASVAILFSCLFREGQQPPGEARIEHLSRMLVLCARFRGHDLSDLSQNALTLFSQHGAKAVIEGAAPHVSAEFRETLFAMICELMTDSGQVSEETSERIGMCALYLQIPMELMRTMVTTYIIRNRFNVEIVD
ncbi:MAG: hypothetical protein EOO11_04090 [Chitinophagaceae bacterium]|nr:MAG: hypothetical protein EOO11_04090 [Chitinophagaceae bacterium]